MTSNDYMNEEAIVACVDLVGRAGASGFEIGYLHDDVPVEEASWYAHAQYRGARFTAEDHRSPAAAALALAGRLLDGATCRCLQPIALTELGEGCRWQLIGRRWEPGCDAAPIAMGAGQRGDHAAMTLALAQQGGNRAERRRRQRRNR